MSTSQARQRLSPLSPSSSSKHTTATATKDADIAAGSYSVWSTKHLKETEEPQFHLFGVNLHHLPPLTQFIICVSCVFTFTLLYGYLQELLSVQLFHRDLALFLASAQFLGYTFWSWVINARSRQSKSKKQKVPVGVYTRLALLRAIDLGMTNCAMKYINYPAKTLLKSSRVIFTMIFGVLIHKKKYRLRDYVIVMAMVFGLALFLHADSKSAAVFQPIGVVMLLISLTCDGVITNWSEEIMRKYDVGQDEFIFQLYSLSLVAITFAALVRGEVIRGFMFFCQPGTLEEIMEGSPPTFSVWSKIMIMLTFATTGFFGSSASSAITKHFGALPMSITSTARKATTLFLSFALFKSNKCTMEHLVGILIFVCALVGKSMKAAKSTHTSIVPSAAMTPSTSHSNLELEYELVDSSQRARMEDRV